MGQVASYLAELAPKSSVPYRSSYLVSHTPSSTVAKARSCSKADVLRLYQACTCCQLTHTAMEKLGDRFGALPALVEPL